MEKDVILRVNDLSVEYTAERGQVHAVSNVSFDIHKGEFFGLAGESGCGKSTIAFSIMRLLKGSARVTGGSVEFRGKNILGFNAEELRLFRWEKTSMVLQSAMNNLNPVVTIGSQLADAILAHESISGKQAYERVKELLKLVNIDESRISAFPHELSGGMRQRVVIAMAMALRPDLIIFDEPTTALDVVVQYNIIKKILQLKNRMGFSILFITHDLPLMLEMCDTIGVMYAGRLVELSPVNIMKRGGGHPYTSGLLKAFPSIYGEKKKLAGIPGSVPDLITPPPGCLFYSRCQRHTGKCLKEAPRLRMIAAPAGNFQGHYCACIHSGGTGGGMDVGI